ncbi:MULTISPECIES: sigma-54-dependent Fis family transcriptional regulator [Fusobacterium]|uniref:sigma-54 interaction domain-containing protein n=1 Tax=Fusobacterium TaxID=848 RepID=UPI001980924F|nr:MULTISPECIES: sigma-54 dependent transcriptional regulator [Fusobacterium]
MKFDYKILEEIEIGVILCNILGEIQYSNKCANEYLGREKINVNEIIEELREKEALKMGFKLLTKTYKNLFFMIFSQKEEGKYLILLKQKDFFKTILNENDSYTNEKKYTFENVIGKSPQILKVIDECKKIADGNSNILITGESGTGKEFFARAIHNNSSRRNFPFIPVNCGSIPRELIESELFGYESGAFTGANKQGYIGKFQLANGGTIFLDEIGEMPLNMQVSLLRVLQDKCVTKIGSKKCTKVDVRVIAATNKCLKDEIKKERFRKDLYYRLNAFNINIPPLKERIGDIPIFLEHLLKEKSIELNKPIPKVPKPLFQKIISYCWPGNIRELQNFVENFVVLDGISTYDINFDECHCMTHDNLGNRIEINQCGVIEKVEDKILPLVELEKREIEKAIKIYDGNMTHIASALGISRNALYNKMKRYGIEK